MTFENSAYDRRLLPSMSPVHSDAREAKKGERRDVGEGDEVFWHRGRGALAQQQGCATYNHASRARQYP